MRTPEREIAELEDTGEGACVEEADKNGYFALEALSCEDGNLNCKNCPFKEVKNK